MFDHYEVLPKKLVGNDKLSIVSALVGAKREEDLKRNEDEVNKEGLKKLFKTTEKELAKDETVMNNVFRQICVRNDECRAMNNDLLGKIEERMKNLKGLRRINKEASTEYKGDFMVSNEEGYQKMIDTVYSLIKLGPEEYKIKKRIVN